jgi:benzoyl-CoA reductase/2-hydroxyglutaryl-CoA dehydratase subunit BcrC/BadD/HgdB
MKIGFTTSFPVEVVYAAGHIPLDLNNIFVTENSIEYVEEAEFNGFPRNVCSWIKGLYSVALEAGIDAVVGVTQGDCSNTHSLMSTLNDKALPIIPFSFPYDKDRDFLAKEILKLETYFDVSHDRVLETKIRLDRIRRKLIVLDELTWKHNKVTGLENHLWLVNSSDFNGDPDDFERRLDEFIMETSDRHPLKTEYRLAYLGVPPIISDLYDFLLEMKVNITFNEIQRQFSMPYLEKELLDQYLKYTYPYSVNDRLNDIIPQLENRNIDGVISYSQAFCHRQIDNILLKKYIKKPFLTIEADQPGPLDARTKLRIESFLDMMRY